MIGKWTKWGKQNFRNKKSLLYHLYTLDNDKKMLLQQMKNQNEQLFYNSKPKFSTLLIKSQSTTEKQNMEAYDLFGS